MNSNVLSTAALCAAGLVLVPTVAHADLSELRWATEGYFRTRTVLLTNLAPQDRVTGEFPPAPDSDDDIILPDIRRTSYVMSRLRLMPTLMYGEHAKLQLQIDAMDDVLWGDNNGLSSAPLFATETSNQHFLGGENADSVVVKRAWMEFKLPVGQMRVGRMPSHWGLGLLANGGGTGHVDPTTPTGQAPRPVLDHFFPEDFGDKHFGSTADRILFVTKPLTILRTMQKAADTSSDLIVGYAYGKLSEAPLLAFEPFERRFRPFGQQGFISRGGDDDVNEHVALAVYNNPDLDLAGPDDELRVGVYGVMRSAREGSTNPSDLDPSASCGSYEGAPVPCDDTGSRVFIADLWWRLRLGELFTEGEAYLIKGTTFGGVPFPTRNTKKDASINAAVGRFGYLRPQWGAMLELGHASGDDDLSDERFTQRAMHPDFNVGLILFEETLRELSARTYGLPFVSEENPDGARGFFSNGGVINANYLFPKGRYRLRVKDTYDLDVFGGILFAWVDTLAINGTAMFFEDVTGGASYLGTEVDLGVRTTLHEHVRVQLETGYLRFGKALKSQLTNADGSFTLQSSVAFIW